MEKFTITPTFIEKLLVIERTLTKDTRGYFSRFYCSQEFEKLGISKPISQINHTLTLNKGAVRGLHFQYPPFCEVKIVSCLKGEIFDVAVDLRRESQTFLKWFGVCLSAENNKSFLIPEGFAHGFQALTDNCELIYLHTSPYQAKFEGALNINDPILGISWPLEITDISERDKSHEFIDNDYLGIPL
jgi:dTDP-4-dehydrorhamnose 3,5-epimerase